MPDSPVRARKRRARAGYVVVQEGGSSGERYLALHDTKREATRHRRDCRRAAYRTSAPIKVPAALYTVLTGKTPLFELLDQVAKASQAVDWPT